MPIRHSNDSVWLTDLLSQAGGDFETNLSTSRCRAMTIGTGFDIISEACDLILKHLENELIFVTCFWAKSDSLSRISHLLLALSEKALARDRKFRVRICVSSLSLGQKLFHTWSLKGKVYKPSEWRSKFRIPPEHHLTGLDLEIKSVFILPFSVMHSKFIVIDRKICLLPSCNVSWEDWFEGCLELRGPVVTKFVDYWEAVWEDNHLRFSLSRVPYRDQSNVHTDGARVGDRHNERAHEASDTGIEPYDSLDERALSRPINGVLPFNVSLSRDSIRMMFLPSQHHQNPRFRPFPCQRPPEFPQTPLNIFTSQALHGSTKSIYMQTPNVTAPSVLDALRWALRRGVNVQIVTNERLMRVEQLVTAGTTTSRCMKKLIRFYKKLQQEAESRRAVDRAEDPVRPGTLQIEYFAPIIQPQSSSSRPTSSHLKLTIVDGQVAILGSGNMDRASWYTSQELGVALLSSEASERIFQSVTAALKDKVQCIYRSFA